MKFRKILDIQLNIGLSASRGKIRSNLSGNIWIDHRARGRRPRGQGEDNALSPATQARWRPPPLHTRSGDTLRLALTLLHCALYPGPPGPPPSPPTPTPWPTGPGLRSVGDGGNGGAPPYNGGRGEGPAIFTREINCRCLH